MARWPGGLRQRHDLAFLLHFREATEMTGRKRHRDEPAVKHLGEDPRAAAGPHIGQQGRDGGIAGKHFAQIPADDVGRAPPRPTF